MKKNVLFWMIVVAVGVVVAFAGTPLTQQIASVITPKEAVKDATLPAGEMVIPVEFMDEHGSAERPGRNPLDVTDSLLFIDSLEGAFPAWSSADLAAGVFWHPDTTRALGGAGTSWWCGAAEIPGYNNHWLQHLILPVVNLSAAASPTLTFKVRWRIEDPVGAEPPYDMWDSWNIWGSADGGTSWNVLTPTAPDDNASPSLTYTGSSSFAFGSEWNFGANIPAYGGSNFETGYVTCTVPLTSLIGSSNARVRISFASDPAFCSVDDPAYFGLHVDSIRVTDGASTLYSNDGTSDGQITLGTGPQSVDTWVYDTDTNHSPTHSWNAEQTQYNVQRAIYSYPVTLPAGYQKLRLTYWVWADMPDQDGNGDNSLEDYYAVYVSTNNGVVWTQVVYDYGYDNGTGNSLAGWVERSGGLTTGGIPISTIELFSGDGSSPVNLRIAFEVKLDDNDDGGSGSGLHIDDANLHAIRASDIDAGTSNMIVPYPVTVGQNRTWTFVYSNEGLNNLSQLRYRVRYFRPDGTAIPPAADSITQVLPGVLNYGEAITGTKAWNPDQAGAWRLRVYSAVTGEQDHSNDTTYSPSNVPGNVDSTLAVYARPAGTYELGYGRHAVGNAYLQPRYTHFTPAADGVPAAQADTIDITQLRIMWRYDAELADSGGRVLVQFWQEGVDSFHTGPLINELITRVDTSETIGAAGMAHWWNLDLTSVPGLSSYIGNFWVSIAELDSFIIGGELTPAPLPLGISPGDPGDGHTYFLNLADNILTQSGGRLLFNVLVRPTQAAAPGQVVDLTIHRGLGGSTDIVLDWDAPVGAHGYSVWRLTTPDQNYQTGTLLTPLPITATTYTDAGIVTNPATRFFYVVIATN